MSKRFAVSTCLLMTICAIQAQAAPAADLAKRTGVVNDYANVIDAATRDRITKLSNELYAKTASRVAVLTIPSLNGEDISSYANQVYTAWGIGKKSNDRGVLILFAVSERRYRVEVGYGLESILPDGKVGGFGREAVPLFKQKQYAQALELITQRVATTIADDNKVTLTAVSPTPAPTASKSSSGGTLHVGTTAFAIFVALLVIALLFIILMIVLAIKLAKRTVGGASSGGWISSGDSSSSFSSSDSSGSSDSGSSGGFDGGSSGGGGADGSF